MKLGNVFSVGKVLMSILLACSCSHEYKEVRLYDIDINNRSSDLSEFVDGMEYVKLEKKDDCLLANIERLKVSADRMFAMDKEQIFVFDRKGKLVTKVSCRGRGKGEYLSITDFAAKDSYLYILSRGQKKILVYNEKGKCVDEILLDNWYNHLEFFNDNVVLLTSENSNDEKWNFVFYDLTARKCVRKECPFDRNESIMQSGFNPICGKADDGFYVVNPFDYTVYKLGNDDFVPYCMFRFNTADQLPSEGNPSFVEIMDDVKNKSVVKYLGMFKERENGGAFLTFNLFEPKGGIGTFLCVADGNGGSRVIRILEEYSPQYPYLSAPKCMYGNALVSVAPASTILNIEEMHGLSLFKDQGLTQESNPVVFFHNLK